MSDFKVGDKVRVTDGLDALEEYGADVRTGDTGFIEFIHTRQGDLCPLKVRFNHDGDYWYMHERHLELVESDRMHFDGGGMREPQKGKARFDLLMPLNVAFDEQFLTRCAVHMAKGAEKYEDRNWEEFSDQEALDRAKASALRHVIQWFNGETDEDHAAAVFFNLMCAEYVKDRIGS